MVCWRHHFLSLPRSNFSVYYRGSILLLLFFPSYLRGYCCTYAIPHGDIRLFLQGVLCFPLILVTSLVKLRIGSVKSSTSRLLCMCA